MWCSSTSSLTALRLLAGSPPSSLTMSFTGWPLIPPLALTALAHALSMSPTPPLDEDWGPVQLQTEPITIDVPSPDEDAPPHAAASPRRRASTASGTAERHRDTMPPGVGDADLQ